MTSNDDNGTASSAERLVSSNFITDIVEADLASGRHRTVVTRFPPEPNGYAHLGHAFASYLDFGIAHDYGGRCNLRFDDTNPEVEEMRYVSSIEEDLRWLGWTWPKTLFSSDYFERLYELALRLVEMGDAYVDSSSSDEIQRLRGTVDRPGTPSPYRDRGTEENLDLFRRMRAGEFPNGSHVLRARIDMASPNMKMRDPLLYRIVHAEHYRTGSAWPIYPFYDFQHPLSDAIEGVTHSLCSLEFVDNRELYDWLVDRLFPDQERPRQYEFGRRNLEYTVVSKRRLMALVRGGHVSGWDDPRMPTLAGLRRAGVRPEAVRDFASRIGVSRTNRTVDIALLEHSVRDDLNGVAKRVMAVTQPLRVVLGNVDTERWLDAPYWPPDVDRSGSREVPFGRELAIERSDFAEHPPKGWRRLSPGAAVRLRHAFVIRCDEVVRDADGNPQELRCTALLDTLGTNPPGVKVAGAIHWVDTRHALPAELRLYDRLFTVPDPGAGGRDFLDDVNPASLVVRHGLVEPSVAEDPDGTRYQFERLGYFWRDPVDGRGATASRDGSAAGAADGPADVSGDGAGARMDPELGAGPEYAAAPLVFNRIVTLKDSWTRRRDAAEASGGADAGGADAGSADAGSADAGSADAGSADAGSADGVEAAVGGADAGGASPRPASASGAEPDPTAALDGRQRAQFSRFVADFGLDRDDAAQLAGRDELAGLFEGAVAEGANARSVANWIVNDLARVLKERPFDELRVTPERLAALVRLVDDGTVTGRVAREMFDEVMVRGTDPTLLVQERGLQRLDDEAGLREIVARVLAEHPAEVAAFQGGKVALQGFFVGQVMRATQGRAGPTLVQRLVRERLEQG